MATKLVDEWAYKISISRNYRKEYIKDWKYWEQVYNDNLWGVHNNARKSSSGKDEFIPQVNEAESIILNILPSILFFPPIFDITADTEEYRLSAMFYELLATKFYEKLDMHDNMEEISIDALILGTGVHKSGYYSDVETSEYNIGGTTASGTERERDIVFSGYVSPHNILIDYGVKRWKDIRWIAEEIDKPLDEVKKNPIYRNTKDLDGNKSSLSELPFSPDKNIKRHEGKNQNDIVTLIEVHDMINGKIITLAEGHDKPLRVDDDYGIPLYDSLKFAPSRPQRIWGKSIMQSLEEHLIRLAKLHYYMDSHGRRGGLTKVLADKARIDKEAYRALKSSNDFDIVYVEGLNEGAPPVQELKFSQVGADFFAQSNVIENIIRMLSGVTMQERGRHEPGVETAYETAVLMEASSRRNKYRIRQIGKFVSTVMGKMLRIASDNWSPDRICNFIGVPQNWAFLVLPYDKMGLEVRFGSTALEAQQTKLQKIMTFAQLMSSAGLQINPMGFGRLVSESLGLEIRENMLLTGNIVPSGGQQNVAGGQDSQQRGALPGNLGSEGIT